MYCSPNVSLNRITDTIGYILFGSVPHLFENKNNRVCTMVLFIFIMYSYNFFSFYFSFYFICSFYSDASLAP